MKRLLPIGLFACWVLSSQAALPAPLRIALAWLALFGSGLLWQAPLLRVSSLDFWERSARAACVHLLGLILLLEALRLGPSLFPFALWVSWLLPIFWRWRRPAASSATANAGGRLFLCLALGLAAWLVWRAPDIDLSSDAPAHLGALIDAGDQDRWRPLDRSAPGMADAFDPRFGVWHGLYAALVRATHSSPEFVLRYSPLVLSPLWLLAHARLFALWIPNSPLALLLALLFTLGGADGRGFGSSLAAYPASVSLAMAALALASIGSRTSAVRTWQRGDVWLLGLCAVVHPFGWWVSMLLLLHAVLLRRLFAERSWSAPLLRAFAISLVLGLLLLTPSLAQRSQSDGGPHAVPLNVVFLGSELFVCDPLRVLRWGGSLCLLLLPLAFFCRRPFFGGARTSLLAAGCLCVWTIALNPLLQPAVYRAVGYLSERLGRVAYPEVFGALLLARPWVDRFRPRRRGARLWLFGISAIGVWLLGYGCLQSWRALRAPAPINPRWQRVHAIATELELPAGFVLIADPTTSYGLRALRGGAMSLYPLAHASPNDRMLPARLTAYRDLLDPSAEAAVTAAALQRLGGQALLVRTDLDRDEDSTFGFVADASLQLRLHERLREGGSRPIAEGEGWWLYAVEGLQFGSPSVQDSVCSATGSQRLARGSRFDVIGVRAPAVVVAGSALELELRYRAHPETISSLHPELERVHLRLSGPMPEIPAWLRPIGKPVRKLLLERSGRSEARFGAGFLPFGAYSPPARWPQGIACERVRLPVPARMPPGNYRLEITVQETTWQPRYDWRDYLSDRDRYSGQPVAQIEIQSKLP